MLIHKTLSNIFIYTISLYVVARYLPRLGFAIIPSEILPLELLLLMGVVFWLIYDIVKRVIGIITLPLQILSIGLFSIILHITMFYVFAYVVNALDLGIGIQLGTFLQVCVLSLVLYLIHLLFKLF